MSFISGCGFEPLYVEKKSSNDWYYDNEFDTGIKDEMASVKVELIQDRIGQLIRNDLLDKLTPKGTAIVLSTLLLLQYLLKFI